MRAYVHASHGTHVEVRRQLLETVPSFHFVWQALLPTEPSHQPLPVLLGFANISFNVIFELLYTTFAYFINILNCKLK